MPKGKYRCMWCNFSSDNLDEVADHEDMMHPFEIEDEIMDDESDEQEDSDAES